MSTEYRIRPMTTGWKLPFNLALLLHILIVASALVLPKYLHKRPTLPDFHTVDLINIAEPTAEPASPEPSVVPPSPTQTPVKPQQRKIIKANKPAVPVAPPVVQEAPPAPIKAISIKPLKRKLKKKLPPDTRARDNRMAKEAEQKRQQQALEIKRQQLLQEAHQQKALADAEEAAANDAVNALKKMLLADAIASSEKSNQQTVSTSRRTGGSNSVLETQYQSSIFSKLQQYWALPEIKQWNPDLTAVVVIQIAKNGRILSHSFEKRSGDRVFDQFVSRTIQEANPLPAIPAALKMQQYTIGLRFKPGRIQ